MPRYGSMFVKGAGQFKANVSGTNQTVLVTRKATRASTLAKVRFPSWVFNMGDPQFQRIAFPQINITVKIDMLFV